MLELQSNTLVFSFPDVHPDARMSIDFQRTLRIPDDGREYPLPPGFGKFPLRHVEDYAKTVPAHWKEHGGIFLPMYPAEAMWLQFNGKRSTDHRTVYPFIVKVGTGKKSALTGKDWRKGIHTGDYCVIPEQKWLDGYVIDEGAIGQFVAAPLGMGLSVEEQLGGDGIGGIQIEVFPMKRKCFERRWPKIQRRVSTRSCRKKVRIGCRAHTSNRGIPASLSFDADEPIACAADCDSDDVVKVCEMGLGSGGRIKQQVVQDPYGKGEWSLKRDGLCRCFVHLANSMAWSTVTNEKPPEVVITAAAYENAGYPWFDTYSDDLSSMKGKKKLGKIKSVKELASEKGLTGIIPENKSVKPKNIFIVPPGSAKAVQNGNW